jgi:glutathione peroxidase
MSIFQKTLVVALPLGVLAILLTSGFMQSAETQEAQISLDQNSTAMKTFHDFTVQTINGSNLTLSSLKGKKVLVVNTASECGLTPQYAQLQELYSLYGGDQFEIIGFPSNDFAGQEPGSEQEIASFCQKNYGVTFPMMAKVKVKGEGIHPVYAWLTDKEMNGLSDYDVKWNFHKFMIAADGTLVGDVGPQVSPLDEEIVNWVKP